MNKEEKSPDFQSFLSIGYLYLIFLGILNETLFYNQVGVEVLKYSSILDVLISPISNLTSGAALFFLLALVASIIFMPHYIAKNRHKKWAQNSFKADPSQDLETATKGLFQFLVVMAAFGLFGLFVGRGASGGYKMAKLINNNELEYNDKVTFLSGDTQEVEVIGKNSSYLFYASKGNSTVKVSPISGAIKSIEENKG